MIKKQEKKCIYYNKIIYIIINNTYNNIYKIY